jgi:hypothetical protein
MAEFIVNPRRAPRAPARCRTAVVSASGSFEAETEDIGAYGCQVVSPKGVRKGEPVRITIANDKVPNPLQVAGRVAWVSSRFPWRVGIAFDEGAFAETSAWFERLIDAHPGMRTLRRLPDKIPVEAVVYLGAPPRFVVDFSEDEAALLRAISSGARIDDLMARFRARGSAMDRALFSLIARSAITLVRGQAVHPSRWKEILDEVEALLAVESMGSGPNSLVAPPPEEGFEPHFGPRAPAPSVPVAAASPPSPRSATPPARPAAPAPIVPPFDPTAAKASPARGDLPPEVSRFGTPPQDPSPTVDLPDDAGLTIEVEEPTPPGDASPAPDPAPDPGVSWGLPPPDGDHEGKGVGWRKPSKRRSGEAQASFDRARSEFLAGNVNGAIALLRSALALAPGDREIADVLGRLAFQDRDPDAR